ncbi:HAMP domain-containing histidine kinase, partial [Clostridium saudiense]|nr:HAMP domain-containing histidine kinase [Clostridium saudiense]
ADTGCGIEESVINKIFEPFYTSKADKGTGLGLSIVVELLKNINGTIKIDSEKEKGTSVKIEFNIIKG